MPVTPESQLGPALGDLRAQSAVTLVRSSEDTSSRGKLRSALDSLAGMAPGAVQKLKRGEDVPLPDHIGEAPGTRLPELAARATDGETLGDRHEAVLMMARLMRQKPEQIEIAARRITEERSDAESIIDAMGTAGTPAAQAALRDVLATPERDVELRKKAAPVFNFVENPVAESATALDSLRNDPEIGVEATLALGSVAGNLGKMDPPAAAALAEKLGAYAHAAGGDGELRRQLMALGNTGNAAALPVLRDYLNHDHARIRAAAVFALRSIVGPEAEGLILAALAADAESVVRQEAIRALSFRDLTPNVAEALAVTVAKDIDQAVRHQAILLAAKLDALTPALRAALAGAAQREDERLAISAERARHHVASAAWQASVAKVSVARKRAPNRSLMPVSLEHVP